MNRLKSELRYPTPFRNAKATNEGESADFANFNSKIGCHGNVPCAVEIKESQLSNLKSNNYHVVKMWCKWVRWILR